MQKVSDVQGEDQQFSKLQKISMCGCKVLPVVMQEACDMPHVVIDF